MSFKVGEKVIAFGVLGVVDRVTECGVYCTFEGGEKCAFMPSGLLFAWSKEPSLKKVEG